MKQKILKILVTFIFSAVLITGCWGCASCAAYLNTPLERPEGYLHVYLHCGSQVSIECYLSPEDYNRWLNGDTGVVTAVPYNIGDDERKVNIATIVTIQ